MLLPGKESMVLARLKHTIDIFEVQPAKQLYTCRHHVLPEATGGYNFSELRTVYKDSGQL